MSEPAPLPIPTPAPETLQQIDKPWWQQKTLWAVVAGLLTQATVFADTWAPFLPERQAKMLQAAAVTLGTLAALFARSGGTQAAGRALEVSEERRI